MIHRPCKWDLQGPDLGPEPWSDFSVMMWGMKLNVQRAYWFGTKMPLRKNLFILLLNGKEEPQEGEKAHCTWLANSLLASCRGSIDIDNLSTILAYCGTWYWKIMKSKFIWWSCRFALQNHMEETSPGGELGIDQRWCPKMKHPARKVTEVFGYPPACDWTLHLTQARVFLYSFP